MSPFFPLPVFKGRVPSFQVFSQAGIPALNNDSPDPSTGQFIRRESDGKVIKPIGWKEPDITGEIDRQFKDGSW